MSKLSIKNKFFFATLSFGIVMGVVFPIYASVFVDFKEHMLLFFVIGCILAGLFVGLFSFFLANQIIFKFFRSVSSVITQMSEGDLSKRIDVSSSDEIGSMVECLNSFASELQGIIGDISETSNTLAQFTSEFSQNTTQISIATKDMGLKLKGTTSSTKEVSQNMNSVANVTGTINSTLSNIASTIKSMSFEINDISIKCKKELEIAVLANKKSKSTNKTMKELEKSTTEIENILNIIKKIASQTDLLALNAAIEAASAGDAGKGFAVVANEVKELAKQTTGASDQIGEKIVHMRTISDQSIKAIEEITVVVEEVSEISNEIVSSVEKQSKTINDISISIHDVGDSNDDVSKNIQRSASELGIISDNMLSFNNGIYEIVENMNRVEKRTLALSGMSKKLEQFTSEFKV